VGRIKRVAAASAVAQAAGELISLAQTVVIARLLGPAQVGVFAAGTVFTLFLAEFSEGGLRSALINRRDKVEEAAVTVFWATAASGLAFSLLALAAAPVIARVFDSDAAGWVAAASSGGLLLYALVNVPEALLQREFSVRRRLIVGPATSAAFAVVAVTLAALGAGVWSLVIGNYASYLTLLVCVWALGGWRPGRARGSFRMWRELARYGFPLIVGSAASKVRSAAEAVVVGRFLSPVALGHYRYGLRIARVPANALIEVVAYALFPAFSRLAGDPARLASAYAKALRWVSLGAAAVAALMFAVGEPAVVVLLGEPWRGAGVAVVAMAGLGLGKAWASVSEEAIKGAGRTGLINGLTAVELILGLALLLLVVPFGLVGVGLSLSITALVVGARCVVVAQRALHVPWSAVAGAVIPAVVAAAVAGGAVRVLERMVLHSDSRSLPVAVGLLAVDGMMLLVIGGGIVAALSPETARSVLAAVRRRAVRAPASTR
jgi:PST family polysaccharide transporter